MLASRLGIQGASLAELCDHAMIVHHYQQLIDTVNEPMSPFERIKKFRLMPYELSIDGGELTPTLKIRRKEILRKFKGEIDEIYRD